MNENKTLIQLSWIITIVVSTPVILLLWTVLRGTAKPVSYTTYRLQGLPVGISKEDAQELIAHATSCGRPEEVTVNSLARDTAHTSSPVATVTFRNTPRKLSSINGSTEWSIGISDELQLVFDTHFDGCTTLHRPSDHDWRFDLIAISGLNGHAFGSFKRKKSSYMWLQDDLPKIRPDIRVIVYGYDSKLQNSQSFQNISDIGLKFHDDIRGVRTDCKKPLFLLGHSLGGIVIKEAMKIMRDSRDETDRMNFTSIRAILFFGVPNQGMHINSLIPVVGNQANRGFLHTLEHNSETLRTQAQQFLETVADLQCRVISFYETQESPTAFQERDGTFTMTGNPTVLVSAQSATHGSVRNEGKYRVHPINRTHNDLVKFKSLFDDPFKTVLEFLKKTEESFQIC